MTKLRRVVKEALNDFFRNGLLTTTTTLIMTLALLCVGIFMVMFLSTNQAIADLKDKIDIVVNFKDSASEAIIQQMKTELMARPTIKSVKYISKEDALNEFKSRDSVKVEVRDIVSSEDNPLPRGLQIQATELSEYDYVSALTENGIYKPYVDSSSHDDNKDLINNINESTKFVERLGLGLSAFFILVASLVVFNTVRLAVHFRSKEIEIMRLVGASETYIKTPFLIEGFLYGLFATVISSGLIFISIFALEEVVKSSVVERYVNMISPVYYREVGFITLVMFMVATVIGLGASWLSIRKNVKI
jgi:cell division transport system permease protein